MAKILPYQKPQYHFIRIGIIALFLALSLAVVLRLSDLESITSSPRAATPTTITSEQTVTGSTVAKNATSLRSSSITGGTNKLFLASVSIRGQSTAQVKSISGLGLTWSKVKAQCSGKGTSKTEVWRAYGNASTGTVTATLTGGTREAAVISVTRYSGVNPISPIGKSIGKNSRGIDSTSCSGGTDAASYSVNLTTKTARSMIYGAVSLKNIAHTPGSGYTELSELHTSKGRGLDAGIASQQKLTSSAGSYAVSGSLSSKADYAVVAVEIRPGTSGAAIIPTRTPTRTLTPRLRVASAPNIAILLGQFDRSEVHYGSNDCYIYYDQNGGPFDQITSSNPFGPGKLTIYYGIATGEYFRKVFFDYPTAQIDPIRSDAAAETFDSVKKRVSDASNGQLQITGRIFSVVTDTTITQTGMAYPAMSIPYAPNPYITPYDKCPTNSGSTSYTPALKIATAVATDTVQSPAYSANDYDFVLALMPGRERMLSGPADCQPAYTESLESGYPANWLTGCGKYAGGGLFTSSTTDYLRVNDGSFHWRVSRWLYDVSIQKIRIRPTDTSSSIEAVVNLICKRFGSPPYTDPLIACPNLGGPTSTPGLPTFTPVPPTITPTRTPTPIPTITSTPTPTSPPATDGSCSVPPTHYNCGAGTLGYTAEYPDQWQWWCNGINGGANVLCAEMKPPTATPTRTPTPIPTNTPILLPTPIPVTWGWYDTPGQLCTTGAGYGSTNYNMFFATNPLCGIYGDYTNCSSASTSTTAPCQPFAYQYSGQTSSCSTDGSGQCFKLSGSVSGTYASYYIKNSSQCVSNTSGSLTSAAAQVNSCAWQGMSQAGCPRIAGSPLSFTPGDVMFGVSNNSGTTLTILNAKVTWNKVSNLTAMRIGSTYLVSNASATSPYSVDLSGAGATVPAGSSRAITLTFNQHAAGATYYLYLTTRDGSGKTCGIEAKVIR